MSRTVIRNARVLTFDESDREFARANIVIDPPDIVAIGPGVGFEPGAQPAEVIEAEGLLAIPGLINGHFHSPANLMKGMLPGLPLELFMLHEVPPLSSAPPLPRLVHVCTLLGAIEMLKRGVTSVQDDAFFVPFPDGDSIDALMSAYATAGMRANVALDQPNIVEYRKLPFLESLLPEAMREEMRRAPVMSTGALLDLYGHLIDRWHDTCDGRIRAAVSCSAPHRVSEDYLDALSDLSTRHDLPFYMHMLETKLQRVFAMQRYGRSLVRQVEAMGHLGPRVNLIHCIWVDAADLDAIAGAGSVIAHNPVCNLRLGSGIMPFRQMRDLGIPICLGSDEMLADDTVNLWAVAKMAGLVHNVTDTDYTRWPSAEELLSCLFRGGARAMGLEQRIGRLAPGFAADIALLDLDSLAFTPLNDVKRQLVYCEDGASVRLTMVAGRVLFDHGAVLGCDEAAIKREARELARAAAPALERAGAAARRLEPYYREMYRRAAATPVGIDRWATAAGFTTGDGTC